MKRHFAVLISFYTVNTAIELPSPLLYSGGLSVARDLEILTS